MPDVNVNLDFATRQIPQCGTTSLGCAGTQRRRAPASAAAIVASGVLGTTLLAGWLPAVAQQPPITANAQAIHAPASLADLVEKVKPAVVSVRVKIESTAATASDLSGPMDGLPPEIRKFLRRFGENGQPRPQVQQAQGSGFFVSADGYIVTNNHVVENANAVTVTTDDGRTLDAKVVGTDPKTDVALLKVAETGPYPYVHLAKGAPRVGDWVMAIGNPFGLGGTVTSGIVSARGRDIGDGAYDYLQIDAPINKGNLGGPTFNLNGEVVGVNTAIYSPSGGSVGLAFAIPSDTVEMVVGQLEKDGHVHRGYLGVQVQSVTKDLADGLGLNDVKGALIDTAQADTPAATAGLKAGDVITAVNGEPIADARALTRKIGALQPDSKAEITYLRDGKTLAATVALTAAPNEPITATGPGTRPDNHGLPRLGLQLAPASWVGAGDHGVAVVGVDPNGPAAETGLQEGDIILEVGGHAVSRPSDILASLEAARKEGRKAILMRIESQNGSSRFVAVGTRLGS
jgi:serine protease Do